MILQRPQAAVAALTAGRDLDWARRWPGPSRRGLRPGRRRPTRCTSCTPRHDRQPKGVVRDNGGHAVALRWSMANIYDTGPGEVCWAASDVGWVVGHSYIVYAPLLAGCTTVLYEGKPVGTPDAGAFWRVVAEHGVKALFTAPTAFRAIKQEDPDGELARQHDLSGLQVPVPGRRALDPETYRWAGELLGVPVVDHWWQTETGWAIAADLRAWSPCRPRPGRRPCRCPATTSGSSTPTGRGEAGETGEIVVRLPLPPGCLPTLWGDDERFVSSYLSQHPGYYITGDGGYRRRRRLPVRDGPHRRRDQRGRPPAVDRADGGGARQPPRRCRVRGDRGGRRAQGPVTARVRRAQGGRQRRPGRRFAPSSSSWSATRSAPVAALRRVDVVAALPKTRSGKILRKTMRGIADGADEAVPSTIDDPAVLDALRPVLTDRD